MSISKFVYAVKNWKSHWRAFWLGTENPNSGKIKMTGQLNATILRADGSKEELGLISSRVVTTAGVNFMRDDFNAAAGAADISSINFHDSGTGIVAEAIGDVNLGTVAGPTTRATGTQSGAVAKVYRSVGTITYAGALAITEHGLFSNATRGSGILWDRSVFAAINVVSGDSIQFTYDLTINDGG